MVWCYVRSDVSELAIDRGCAGLRCACGCALPGLKSTKRVKSKDSKLEAVTGGGVSCNPHRTSEEGFGALPGLLFLTSLPVTAYRYALFLLHDRILHVHVDSPAPSTKTGDVLTHGERNRKATVQQLPLTVH